ncbi:MAG: cytochrome-c peroxidase [Chitinophagaceae bacterium]|nr:cytochrome-c peroxidase [Chitinophagaceae bacterium]
MLRIVLTIVLLVTGLVIIVEGCKSPKEEDKPVKTKSAADDFGKIDALPVEYKSPKDNLSTPEKIELGRLLFYDPILSGGKDVACATCHHPEFGYAESLEISIGVNGKGLGEKRVFNKHNDIPFTKRNSPSLLNVVFNGIDNDGNYFPDKAPMFWDLRAKGLEDQATFPVRSLEEMRGHSFKEDSIAAEIAKRVDKIPEYKQLFKKSFSECDTVTIGYITKAIATFERSLLANNSRFDKYMRGDKNALSGREIDGMKEFIKAGCARCHNGPMLSDFKVHVLGVQDNEKNVVPDSGYNKTLAFRTPTLRNLRVTRPYMHSGKIQTLDNVLLFYEDLRGKPPPNKSVTQDNLDSLAKMVKVEFKNIDAIVEFLNTLNDDNYDRKIPDRVPSGLPVGGMIK